MTLAAEVISRYSNQRLVELTNQDDRPASTYDSTRLGLACADATGEFETLTGLVLDVTDAKHLAVALKGVEYMLQSRRGIATDELEKFQTRWEKACEDLRKVTFNNRIRPATTSILTPTSEQDGVEVVAPDFDRPSFKGIVPAPPTQGWNWRPDDPGA